MITSYNTLLPVDNPHVLAVDIGVAIKPIPMRDKVMELDVVAIITNVSNIFYCSFCFIFFNFLF